MISVVVPVGRVDAHLEAQLEALVEQTIREPFEVVLALNDTDPGAQRRLEDLLARLDRSGWRIVAAHGGRGPSHARNAGVAAAGGDVLAFCDADDLVEPQWLERLVEALEGHDAVSGHVEGFGLTPQEAAARPPLTTGELPTYMGVPYLLSGNLAIRREAFEAVGGFDEDLQTCEDMALGWSLLVAGRRIGFAPEARVAYRYRSGWKALVVQHVRYGRGMSQLMLRRGVPRDGVWTRPNGRLLASNGRPGAEPSLRNSVRRASIAAGRLLGIAGEWRRR